MQCCSKEFMRDLYQYYCYWNIGFIIITACVCVYCMWEDSSSMQGNHLRGNNCGDGAILGV